ncbi:hypothetical protein V4V35_23790 [Bacillus infantis]|uniref:hypothetical protein n=1 Tax=Bacillus infantis TaxID=324767 RepID=UPI002FBDB2B5
MRSLQKELKKWRNVNQPEVRNQERDSKSSKQGKQRFGSQERLSRRDIEELMGTNRPVYERRRGALKRK